MKITGIVAALVTGSAFTLGTSLATPPANADATGTVKAQTQRTNAPNLGSQDGVYNVGEKLTLVCSTPGENVKGFFSFNEPNGGWDNLWYRTSDNHYVADVDIETGTLKAVAPDCGTLGSQGQQSPQQQAGSTSQDRTRGATIDYNPLSDYEGYCTWGAQEKVHDHTGYYIQALRGTAVNWANEAKTAGWTVVDDAQPRSIVVFSSAVAGNPDGHVAWVDAVNGKDVTITEMNYGPGATAANGYRTTGFHKFDTRTVKDVPGMSYILIP
jgi:surface antigen